MIIAGIIVIIVFMIIPDRHFLIKWLLNIITMIGAAFVLYYFYQDKQAKTKELADQIIDERKRNDD